MIKIYACLLGQWTELTEEDSLIGPTINELQSPYNWSKDPNIANLGKEVTPMESTFYNMPIVYILHKGLSYQISPVFIQIVVDRLNC